MLRDSGEPKMEDLKEKLWQTLQDLREDEFKTFKWFLKQGDVQEGFPGIPAAQLEKAERQDTVDLMVQKHQGPGALKVTLKVLEKISRNDLVQQLQHFSWPKGPRTHYSGAQKEEHNAEKAELKRMEKFAVDVTLDPDTAHPNLILSADGKRVHHVDETKALPENPKRFKSCNYVLGKQGFSSGRFYFEVQVRGKTAWTVGVATESIDRKGITMLSPEDGFWTIALRNEDEYTAAIYPIVHLSLNHPLKKVGVFVDYEEGLVSFYDVDSTDLLYSFTGCSFTEDLLPLFSPCSNDRRKNSAPLIISPVRDQEVCERKKAGLKSVQKFAVDVTLDPDTAHPALIVSDDGKQVYDGDVMRKVPRNPKRFKRCVNVLGKQGFSSGRFYFEVQVRGNSSWTLGVVKESIDRKGIIIMTPEEGFWTIALRNEDEYSASENPPVILSPKSHPQKVGVFVDYEEGLVSFYDVDSADLLHSFAGCSFTQKLLPFFGPEITDGGSGGPPVIITPVNQPLNSQCAQS